MRSYEVLQDPLEPTETWRVAVDDHFTVEKFGSQSEADVHLIKLATGLASPTFGDHPVVVRRDVVAESADAILVRTQIEHEAFTFTTIFGDAVTWDVTRAREAVERGETVGFDEIPLRVLAEIAASNEWTQDVVDKADTSKPGIAAPLKMPTGQVIYVLIDGTHRAVRALKDKKPFSAWMLNDAANRRCLVRGKKELIP